MGRRLRAEDTVDFEDMLVRAAEHLEAGRADGGADLVMVDEFQDASQGRAGSPGHWSPAPAASCSRWATTGSRSTASPGQTRR